MSVDNKQSSTQRDANLAADERPVPSQAEGDRDTIEQDLAEKAKGAPKPIQQRSAGANKP